MIRSLLLAPLALALAACGSPSSESTAPPEPAPMPQVDLAALGVPNAAIPQDGLLCAGQLSVAQMDALAAAGFEHFISLRVAQENGAGWEEDYTAEKGIEFERMPIAGADGITSENARALRARLDALEGPTVLYCGSSNRVGALLGLAAHELDGKSPEDALAYAKSAGLTGLEPVVRQKLGLE